jgi:hypothetical protein
MDHILDWPLIDRSAEERRDLFRQSGFGMAPVRLELEPAGVASFAFCRKEYVATVSGFAGGAWERLR